MTDSFEEQLVVADFIDAMRGRVPNHEFLAKRITNTVALIDALERAAYIIVALQHVDEGFAIRFKRSWPWVRIERRRMWLAGPTDLNTIGRVLQEVEGKCPPEIVFSEWGKPL